MSRARQHHHQQRARNARLNPVARAAERARMEKWRRDNIGTVSQLQHGEECPDVIVGLIEAFSVAAVSMYGWDDPDAVGDVLLTAIDALQAMANDGRRWDATKAAEIVAAINDSSQVSPRMPVEDVARAKVWVFDLLSRAGCTKPEAAEVA